MTWKFYTAVQKITNFVSTKLTEIKFYKQGLLVIIWYNIMFGTLNIGIMPKYFFDIRLKTNTSIQVTWCSYILFSNYIDPERKTYLIYKFIQCMKSASGHQSIWKHSCL